MLSESDVHTMQHFFDAIEDTAQAMAARARWRMKRGPGKKPPSAFQILDECLIHKLGRGAFDYDENGEPIPTALWHRCMSLALDIAMHRYDLRSRRGSQRRLDRATVLKIYQAAHEGSQSHAQIARVHGVNPKTVSEIKLRNRYANYTDPDYKPHIPTSKLSADEACEIYTLANEEELTHREIAEQYGVSRKTISAIKRGVLHATATMELGS